MNDHVIGLTILSIFCAGGLFAYLREVRRLGRLISSGTVARATVLKKEKIDSGSESVVHYLVTYEFADERGGTVTREEDVNGRRFFDSLSEGGTMDVLYQRGAPANSYPLDRVRADLKISRWICASLALFWAVMGAYFLL